METWAVGRTVAFCADLPVDMLSFVVIPGYFYGNDNSHSKGKKSSETKTGRIEDPNFHPSSGNSLSNRNRTNSGRISPIPPILSAITTFKLILVSVKDNQRWLQIQNPMPSPRQHTPDQVVIPMLSGRWLMAWKA